MAALLTCLYIPIQHNIAYFSFPILAPVAPWPSSSTVAGCERKFSATKLRIVFDSAKFFRSFFKKILLVSVFFVTFADGNQSCLKKCAGIVLQLTMPWWKWWGPPSQPEWTRIRGCSFRWKCCFHRWRHLAEVRLLTMNTWRIWFICLLPRGKASGMPTSGFVNWGVSHGEGSSSG